MLIIVLLTLRTLSYAQEGVDQKPDTFNIKSESFYLPLSLPYKTFRHTFWISHYFLPSDWTNLAINAPMFNYSARYSLPKGFAVEGTVSTLFVSNRFTLGPKWNYSKDKIHVGLHYYYGYNLGVLNDFGFSTLVTAWSHMPGVAVGYSFQKTSLTLRMGLEYLGNFYYKTGDNVVSNDNFKLNGSYVGLVMEQRLWNDHLLSFSFDLNHVNFVMLAWPAYPVNNKKYFVPQINFGITF